MIGIYMMSFNNGDSVYIGQSATIDRRFKEHTRTMLNGTHDNYKVLQAYKKYGLPEFIVLSECSLAELDSLERSWIEEFDSINNGLNISDPFNGYRSLTARHSKRTILKIFSLLYRTTQTQMQISKRTGVPKPTIAKIACGNSHVWLLEQYPEQYAKMKDSNAVRLRNNRAGGKFRTYPTLIDPDGKEWEVTNVAQFCRDHYLLKEGDSGIGQLMLGIKKQYKGFRLKDRESIDFSKREYSSTSIG